MSNDVTIANMALSLLGAAPVIESLSPPDGTEEAGMASRFLPLARRTLLAAHPWRFASRREKLALMGHNDSTTWDYAYQRPNRCLVARRVVHALARDDDDGAPFDSFDDAVYTDEPDAHLVYTCDVLNYLSYPPGFVTAFALLLASLLAGPLVRGAEGVRTGTALRERAEEEARQAALVDARQTTKKVGFREAQVPDLIRARD